VGCSAATAEFTSIKNLKNFKTSTDTEVLFDTYDLNNDKEIRFSEFTLVNSMNKKCGEEERECFVVMDLNHDWKLTRKEIGKVKFSKISANQGKKKR
jgi:Ca2+-binding EF-hand superfamily protein